jgi:Protein of unknown function (DUF3300)
VPASLLEFRKPAAPPKEGSGNNSSNTQHGGNCMFQVHALPIRHNHRGHEGLAKQQLYQVRRPSLTRLTLMALVVGVLLAAPAVSSSQPVLLTPPQLDQLVTRIAPYPDPLLAQVLTASTYSNQIAEAATWADQHSYLKGRCPGAGYSGRPVALGRKCTRATAIPFGSGYDGARSRLDRATWQCSSYATF